MAKTKTPTYLACPHCGSDREPADSSESVGDMFQRFITAVAKLVATELSQIIATGGSQYMTVEVAAGEMGLTPKSVRHHIAQKDFPVMRLGKRIMLDRRDIEKWAERSKDYPPNWPMASKR